MNALFDPYAGRTLVATVYWTQSFTIQGLADLNRGQFFSYALVTVEQVGARNSTASKGLIEGSFGAILAQNVIK